MTFLLTVIGLLPGNNAFAEDDSLSLSGAIGFDVRYRPVGQDVGCWYEPLELSEGFALARTTLDMALSKSTEQSAARAEFEIRLPVTSEKATSLDALSDPNALAPIEFVVDSLFVEFWDIGVTGLDLRVGQQLVQWGVGDQFNPTNNLNPNKLDDPLAFGEQAGNLMVRADYHLGGMWSISGVVVPIFKGALLPPTSYLGLSATDRNPILNDELRHRLIAESSLTSSGLSDYNVDAYPVTVTDILIQQPSVSLSNMQWSGRLAGAIGMHDLALSYYRGRADVPVPIANHTTMNATPLCHPDYPDTCIGGLLETSSTLAYPEMSVWGFNMTGELPLISWISSSIHPFGYRAEFAWIDPSPVGIALTNDELDFGFQVQEAGEYDYGLMDGYRPLVIDGRAFAKWSLGLDYTFGRALYTNLQWVHGLPDEFGAGDWLFEGYTVRSSGTTTEPLETMVACVLAGTGETCAEETKRNRIGDYAVLGADLNLGDTILRAFAIVDLTGVIVDSYDGGSGQRVTVKHNFLSDLGHSFVLYPELIHNFGDGATVSVGGLVMAGGEDSKFGEAAAGGSLVFVRGSQAF